jgi:hypothetical protein
LGNEDPLSGNSQPIFAYTLLQALSLELAFGGLGSETLTRGGQIDRLR